MLSFSLLVFRLSFNNDKQISWISLSLIKSSLVVGRSTATLTEVLFAKVAESAAGVKKPVEAWIVQLLRITAD